MLRVLIVEDDPRVLVVNQGFVDRIEGFAVVGKASTLAEAIRALDELQPDLVILDLYLPEGHGLDLLRQVRSRGNPVDVIVVTAAKEADALHEALRGGVVDYIVKPYRFERFAETLRRYREYHTRLERPGEVRQEEVDRLLAHRPPPASVREGQPPLPKGIDELTLQLVARALAESDRWLAAEEFGARLGLSRTTTRRYLEYLVEVGQAAVRHSYGSVGRPERLYGLAPPHD